LRTGWAKKGRDELAFAVPPGAGSAPPAKKLAEMLL